jgi:SAM-dependent methyltransferase
LQTLAEIRAMLDERGLRPKKSLGQNFLVDHNLLQRLVDESGAGEGDVVLEVGPGTGTLTETLLERGCRVVAVELDDALAELLRDRLMEKYEGRFTLIHADCLGEQACGEPGGDRGAGCAAGWEGVSAGGESAVSRGDAVDVDLAVSAPGVCVDGGDDSAGGGGSVACGAWEQDLRDAGRGGGGDGR